MPAAPSLAMSRRSIVAGARAAAAVVASQHVRGCRLHALKRQACKTASSMSEANQPASNALPLASAAAAAATSLLLLLGGPGAPAALAKQQVQPAPISGGAERCTLAAFDNFANTRAKFSMEASSGAMGEALVDVRECSFKDAVLDGRVLSGALMQGTDCRNCSIRRAEAARADMRGADLQGVVFEDTNLYGTLLGGADLRGATFDNAILSNASFGKDDKGRWAQLEGAHFEGALLSSSDVERLCVNPTLDDDVKKFELGCRSSK